MRSVIFPSFTYAKRGIFYFGRRVPKDVQRFYGSPKVVLSLRTRSVKRAERQAQRIAAKLEEQWDLLRLVHLEGRVGNNRLEVPTSQRPFHVLRLDLAAIANVLFVLFEHLQLFETGLDRIRETVSRSARLHRNGGRPRSSRARSSRTMSPISLKAEARAPAR